MQVKVLEYKNNQLDKFTHRNLSSGNFLRSSKKILPCVEEEDDQYRKMAIKWILSYSHKTIARDTQYLAISYINFMRQKSLFFNSENYQIYSVTILLIACKLNQIYPPKITLMLSKCIKSISKQQILDMEAQILQIFGFDINLENTVYTYIYKILGSENPNHFQQCERLLKSVCHKKQIYLAGEETLAYSIIYLMLPKFIKSMHLIDQSKIKALAMKILAIYQQLKKAQQKLKQNKEMNQ